MRRRCRLKCCASFLLGISLFSVALMLYYTVNEDTNRMENEKLFQAIKISLTKRLHSTQDEDSVCYELQEVHNDKVKLHYDISTLNLLGLIETPEDQIIRDEGNIKIFLKKSLKIPKGGNQNLYIEEEQTTHIQYTYIVGKYKIYLYDL